MNTQIIYTELRFKMRYLYPLVLAFLANASVGNTQSDLLKSVRSNPNEAIALCNYFKTLNSQGISASSAEALNKISNDRNLSKGNAEILSIYVIGLHCPEVK